MPINSGILSFGLVTEALARSERAVVAELVSRGKEQIVIIRPYRDGLVLHGMYYQNEVRDLAKFPKAILNESRRNSLNLVKGLLSECPATNLNRKNTA